MQALLDTGSPATIISLDLIVRVLATQKPKEQTPEQLKNEMRQKLKPTTMSLQNYGGGRLELIRQTSITLTRNGHTTCAIVQVQKDAPVELLLGTDTVPQLGFALLETDLSETGVDLLQEQIWIRHPRGAESTSISNECELATSDDQISMQPAVAKVPAAVPDTELRQAMAPQRPLQQFEGAVLSREEPQLKEPPKVTQRVVRLLQAVRLPAHHRKVVQAKVEGCWDRGLAVFDPEPDFMEEDGLDLAEAVVEQDKSQMVTLVMENASYEPARLKKGRVLGQLSPVTMAIAIDEEDPLNEPYKLVSTLVMPKQVAPTPVERTQLLKDLQLESETVRGREREVESISFRIQPPVCARQK